jgi:hypothetical protein
LLAMAAAGLRVVLVARSFLQRERRALIDR